MEWKRGETTSRGNGSCRRNQERFRRQKHAVAAHLLVLAPGAAAEAKRTEDLTSGLARAPRRCGQNTRNAALCAQSRRTKFRDEWNSSISIRRTAHAATSQMHCGGVIDRPLSNAGAERRWAVVILGTGDLVISISIHSRPCGAFWVLGSSAESTQHTHDAALMPMRMTYF